MDTTLPEKPAADSLEKELGSKRPSSASQQKGKIWPAMISDDWCPPGTSISNLNKGSIHTCSDKICRWNYLGIQGSLLSSLLDSPLYLSTLTVGRKLTECICRRAVCCRIGVEGSLKDASGITKPTQPKYHLNHPAIMGTAVYMDEGDIETRKGEVGQDVRFHSTLSWAWWPHRNANMECIDGSTGFLAHSSSLSVPRLSLISTFSLFNIFIETYALANPEEKTEGPMNLFSLTTLRLWKTRLSPHYEATKTELFAKHPILRQWKRRINTIQKMKVGS
jgi:hypothetical protein